MPEYGWPELTEMSDIDTSQSVKPASAIAADTAVPKTEPEAPEGPVSLKTFLLLNILWLPLAVFVWFAMRSFIAYPITRLARWGLDWWLPGVIESSRQYYQFFKFTALIPLPPGMVAEAGQVPAVDATSDALLYTYGLAVLWGLTLATPEANGEFSLLRRLRTCLLGWLILIPLQSASMVIDVAKTLFIDLGSAGLQMAEQHGVSLEVIAYLWQLSRLVVPTLSALIVWAIFHRRFIEHIRFDSPLEGEPLAPDAGPSRNDKES
jgi:hypothetical protein